MKNLIKNCKKEAKGITLIVLIITIIIMLILIAVVIDVAIDGKLIDSAKEAVSETNNKVGQGIYKNLDEAAELIKVKNTYVPNPVYSEKYEKNYQVFKKLYNSNKKNFKAINTM